MERWYRVFGGEGPCDPYDLVLTLRAGGFDPTAHVQSDDGGWFRVELSFPDGLTLSLDRYHANEDGIRAELNSWAAWVEAHGDDPAHVRLMERLIQSVHLFTLAVDSDISDRRYDFLIGSLALLTGGIYQIDGRGIFDAGGAILLAED